MTPMKSVETPSNPLDVVRLGATHEVEGLVQLELTAEQMVKDETALLGAYVHEDSRQVQGFWDELKEEVVLLELEMGQWLLSAADPTRVEWQRAHWWQSAEEGAVESSDVADGLIKNRSISSCEFNGSDINTAVDNPENDASPGKPFSRDLDDSFH